MEKKFNWRFLQFGLLLVAVACSTGHERGQQQTPAFKADKANLQVQQEFAIAQKMFQSNSRKKAQGLLKQFILHHPSSELAPRAQRMLGQIDYDSQLFPEALEHWSIAEREAPSNDAEFEFRMARAAGHVGDYDLTYKLIAHILEHRSMSNEQQNQIYLLLYETHMQTHRHVDALATLVYLAEHPISNDERDKARSLANEFVQGRLTSQELQQVADSDKFGFVAVPAKFRYANLLMEEKQFVPARQYFKDLIALAPESELAQRSQTLMGEIDARERVDAHTIGVVLPLTGKRAIVGYKTLHGIQLALGIFGRNPANLRLSVIDSEANPEAARKAVERLVLEDNVIAIIGGVEGHTVASEAAKAHEFGIPFIALSQKPGVTQIGDSVFRNALTGPMLTSRLVAIAMEQKHMSRFAIVFPNDSYGVEYANLFWDDVRARGGQIVAAQSYDPKETDFGPIIQRLIGTYYLEDRMDEYHARFKDWQEKNPKRTGRTEIPTPQKLLPPIADFDAIFIPDNAATLSSIASYLPYYDVEKMFLLGTNIWNNPSLLTRPELRRALDFTVFVDGFLNTEANYLNSPYYAEFKQTFEEDPGVFELLGYDAALMLRQGISSGQNTRQGVIQYLAGLHDFRGAISPLTMTANREVRRPVIDLRIEDGKIIPLSQQTRQE